MVLEEEYDIGIWFNRSFTDLDKEPSNYLSNFSYVNFQLPKCSEGLSAGRSSVVKLSGLFAGSFYGIVNY